ncbi:MAG: hypothetical protein ABT940_12280 [Alphaproteobacteria bacterium]
MTDILTSLSVSPHLPVSVLVALAVATGVGLALPGLGRERWRSSIRILPLLVLWAMVLEPRMVVEKRTADNDVALVLVDDSPSQTLGDRTAQTDAALRTLTERLRQQKSLDVRVARLGALNAGGGEGTRLLTAARRAIADLPLHRLAGVFLITDGEIHDVPPPGDAGLDFKAPVHALLTGKPDEGDRQLMVREAPGFGIVGKTVSLTLQVDDTFAQTAGGGTARLTVRRDGGAEDVLPVPVGRPFSLPIEVSHGGSNVVEMEVEPGPAELSLANNRTAVTLGGVRDRLHVLLISGRPHAGERSWRNILKSDPNVDLVHFTILRPLEKNDLTPLNELSLISFPMRELFEEKLRDFDLVIFDRYSQHDLVPAAYLQNVARHVHKGGAVLVAAGPEFGTSHGLAATPLGDVLPARPSGQAVEVGFVPRLTGDGFRHPVTTGLKGAGSPDTPPTWGRWFRQARVDPDGDVLMTGAGDLPLLILKRVDEGRVALILSDTLWLWSKGFEGGGPEAELLRRLAHWLMKEPELEENALVAEASDSALTITRRHLKTDGDMPTVVTVTTPSGEVRKIPLTTVGGQEQAVLPATEPGLYRLSDGVRSTVGVVGGRDPLEFRELAATDRLLRPVAKANGGGIVWLSQGGVPEIRRIRPGRDTAGHGWLGLLANGSYTVTGIEEVPLMPAWLALLLSVGGLTLAWWYEGRY